MIPTRDTQHSAEALALLTDVFKGKPVIEGLLKCIMVEVQDLEDQLFVYLSGIVLSAAVGDVLDKYGSIVGVARDGLSDSLYRAAIQVKIKVNHSAGQSEDVIGLAALVLPSFIYQEWPNAAFTVASFDLDDDTPIPVLSLLGRAGPAGVKKIFLYSTWPAAQNMFFTSRVGTVTGAPGWDDAVSGNYPSWMVSSDDFLKDPQI